MKHPLPDHPAALMEAQHLSHTLAIIQGEIGKLEGELGVGVDEEREVAAPQADMLDQEVVAINMFRMKLQTLHQLGLSRHQPYFSHLEFIPEGGVSETHYIGRWGVAKSPEYTVEVVDWRSPVANLYYSGQVGPMEYDAPDGTMRGELTLKRMLGIEDGKLTSIFDSGVVSQDAYLQEVLGSVSSDRLREIVTTIQAEQNIVIRHTKDIPLVVQGVAGSGKTTIALHRIAWMLYAYQETLAPAQMMIIAPNPLFLDYISAVLPDLGVEQVHQTTFQSLCAQWLKKQMPKVKAINRLEEQLHRTEAEREQLGAVLRYKGSLAYKKAVDDFLLWYEHHIVPTEDVTFGQTVLYTGEELRHIFITQLKHFPLALRVKEAHKYVQTRLAQTADNMTAWLESACEKRLAQLLATMADGPLRREKAVKLLESREVRVAEVAEQRSIFVKSYPDTWPDMSLLHVFGLFMDWLEAGNEKGDPVIAGAVASTRESLAAAKALPEDLAALVVIGRRLWGMPRMEMRHVVIDEAQDFSPFQIHLLTEAVGHHSFTMVGDLMQGVHADEGIRDWEAITGGIFGGKADLTTLVVSYRNTVEIMELASAIARRHPVPGQVKPQPVLRHGDKPVITSYTSDKGRIQALVDMVAGWKERGYRSIAIVEKTRERCRDLHKALPKSLEARLVREGDTQYRAGVMVIPASMVKGLEFDCVLVPQVNHETYPDDPWHTRLLYVLCTRPLHQLALLYTGEKSPLVPEME